MRLLLAALIALVTWTSVEARPRAITAVPAGSQFNGGTWQLNFTLTGIGGDYPFINLAKNGGQLGWTDSDNSQHPFPNELDVNGYPTSTSDSIVNHGGVYDTIRIPAQAYIGGNCINGAAGICFVYRPNGKGTVIASGTVISSVASGVTTGATTTITFSSPQDFRAGMEVPISGTTGVTATNGGGGSLTGGGTSGAWTVCAANLTSTQIQLCLNDQVTPLTTTGTAGGTTTVSYGRTAVGVPAKGRIITVVTGSPPSITWGISAQNATTPITYRNGVDGMAIIVEGPEETRYEAGQIASAKFLSVLNTGKPGVIRGLNTINTNDSQEVFWADRKQLSYVSWSSGIYDRTSSGRSSVFVQTTSVGNDYSATLGTGAPTDREQLSIQFDAASVSVTSGANALVTWTAHGLQNGQPFNFFFLRGGSLPGGVSTADGVKVGSNSNRNNTNYYAITTCGSCDADHIQFADTQAHALAGTAFTTTTTGASVLAHVTVESAPVSVTASSANMTWANNYLTVGDFVQCSFLSASPLLFTQQVLYVKTVAGSTVTLSATNGGTAIVFPTTTSANYCVRSPTLNINGTGPVPIASNFGTAVGGSQQTIPLARQFGSQPDFGVMTYDDILKLWLKRGADISFGTAYFISGWPPEILLELAKEIGAHPWFDPPAYVVDGTSGITDYETSLFTYVQANSPSWMIPRFAVIPNEYWNGKFIATSIGIGHAYAYSVTAGWDATAATGAQIHQIAGKVSSVIGQAASNTYGGVDPLKYWAIANIQTGGTLSANFATSNAERMTASNYVGQSTSPQSPYTKSSAATWLTHISVTGYTSPGYYLTPKETTLATAYSGGRLTGSVSTSAGISTLATTGAVTGPAIDVGTTLIQGPGITPGTTLTANPSGNNWTLSANQGTVGSATSNIMYTTSASDPTAVGTWIDSFDHTATFTGVLATDGKLTVSSVTGYVTFGANTAGTPFYIDGAGIGQAVTISSQISGVPNGAGIYQTSQTGTTIGPELMGTFGAFTNTGLKTVAYPRAYAFAQSYSNIRTDKIGMTAYEGGYATDPNSLESYNILATAGKLAASSPGSANGVQGYVNENCVNFAAQGGQFCSLFQFTGISASLNDWSALDDIWQPAPTPYWDGYTTLH